MIRYSRFPQLPLIVLHLVGCATDPLDLGDDRPASTLNSDEEAVNPDKDTSKSDKDTESSDEQTDDKSNSGSDSTPGGAGNDADLDETLDEGVGGAPHASTAGVGSGSMDDIVDDSGSEDAGVATATGGSGAMPDLGSFPDLGDGGLPSDPFAPREGSFRVLAYSRTSAFRADQSINEGHLMLSDLGAEYGFEVVRAEDNDAFTTEGLAKYELVIFLNTSGDVLNTEEEDAFEQWMTERHGAFLGTSRAADTEREWAFYHELIGQYYDGHTSSGLTLDIEWAPGVEAFPAVRDLPSPWQRHEPWFYFDSYLEWSAKPGFQILSTVTLPARGTEGTVTTPVSFSREWSNFRSFYAGLGHDEGTFQDPLVQQHILGGLLWAVRREHWLD